jgi:hypothetical protein
MNVSLRYMGVAVGLFVLAPRLLPGQVAQKQEQHNTVLANGYYARETEDREWHLRLVGEIPSLCGTYIVIHDAAGKIIHHGMIPRGQYPADKPYEVAIKADGIVGDYKIIFVGHQNDRLGLSTPYTDLPFEVYGGEGDSMSIGHALGVDLFFQVPAGVEKMKLGAYFGKLKVTDKAGAVIADTRVSGKVEKYDTTLEFAVKPGETYRLARECFYFRSFVPNTFYFAFDPARCFSPTSTLDQVKWWEGVK